MAAPVRRLTLQRFILTILLLQFSLFVPLVSALPHEPSITFHSTKFRTLSTTRTRNLHAYPQIHHEHTLASRGFEINNSSGTPQIFNPTTQQFVPQGAATDGGGQGWDVPSIIWLVFSFVVGVPMAIAGIRLWRITTGVGIGLSAAVCSWAALNNSVNNNGVPDAVLTAIIVGFFVLGFILGLFEIGRVAGIGLLGITGGLAFGIRADLLKEGLLISDLKIYFVNWVVVAVFGVLGGSMMVSQKTQRAGIVSAELFGSASVGTFLVALGVDVIINRQSGMSRGLRFLFDRNASHALDIIVGGYHPTLSTQIVIAVSMGLTPILAFVQHRAFKQPFSRKPRPESEMTPLPDFFEDKDANRGPQRQTFLFNLWSGAQTLKPINLSRFSL
ncbi:hypothetical protein H0H87_004822 [Tephrocybe sp. NHM501043]|nr:hypothetical protein H0H87_004822 [Tephrocybe sp. NHM501043]